jgi:hypothetical protein
MAGTPIVSVEEQVKRLAALPLPRAVRSTASISSRAVIVAFVVTVCSGFVYDALSRHPHDYLALCVDLASTVLIAGMFVLLYANPGLRNPLQWGTPTVGRVLSSEKRGNAMRIRFSYETTLGTAREGDINVYRRRDLTKGVSVVVFYDRKLPEKSSILGCKGWDVKFSGSHTASN